MVDELDLFKDAERYRWWRDNACAHPIMVAKKLGPLVKPHEIDAMIDEAMAEEQGRDVPVGNDSN